MKLTNSLLSCLLITAATAFAPPRPSIGAQQQNVILSDGKVPFFGSAKPKAEAAPATADNPLTDDEKADEIENMVREEMKKKKKISNLRNSKGVDYAPWMNISEDDEKKIRTLVEEKQVARRKRQEQERQVSGALLMDSQAQELSGSGLRSKIIGTDVELTWATSREANTKGFVLKRRPAKTDDFEILASYEDWSSLASKGLEGGVYRFLDDSAGLGGWVYRVTEVEKSGRESDISQCLVEVQSKEEQQGAVIAAGAIAVLVAGLFVAGTVLDPNGGF